MFPLSSFMNSMVGFAKAAKTFVINLANAVCVRATTRTVLRGGLITTVPINTPAMTDDSLSVAASGTNLLLWSEDYTDVLWTKFQATISADAVVAPDGLTTADRIVEVASTNVHVIFSSHGNVGDTCFSAFVKAGERTWAVMRGDITETWFDVVNGVVGTVGAGVTASIKDFGNGWFLCSAWINLGAAGNVQLGTATGDGVSSFLGDITKGLYVWGTQVVSGQVCGPYRKTEGSTTTTAADICTSLTPSVLTAESWALEVEFNPDATGQSGSVMASYTDANNYVELITTATTVVLRKRVAGVNYDTAAFSYTHAAGTLARAQMYGGATGTGVRVADSSADITVAVFTTNADTTDTVWASTINWGHLNGTISFVGEFYNVGNPTAVTGKGEAGW